MRTVYLVFLEPRLYRLKRVCNGRMLKIWMIADGNCSWNLQKFVACQKIPFTSICSLAEGPINCLDFLFTEYNIWKKRDPSPSAIIIYQIKILDLLSFLKVQIDRRDQVHSYISKTAESIYFQASEKSINLLLPLEDVCFHRKDIYYWTGQ